MAKSASDLLKQQIKTFMHDKMEVHDTLLSCFVGTRNPEKVQLQFHTIYPQETSDSNRITLGYNRSDDDFGDGFNKPIHWATGQIEDIIRIHPEYEDAMTKLVEAHAKNVATWEALDKATQKSTPFPKTTSEFLGGLNPVGEEGRLYVTYWESLIPTEEKLKRAKTASKRNPKTDKYLTVNGYRIYGYKSIAYSPFYERIEHNREIGDFAKTISLTDEHTEADVDEFVYGIVADNANEGMPVEDTVERSGQLSE